MKSLGELRLKHVTQKTFTVNVVLYSVTTVEQLKSQKSAETVNCSLRSTN